MEQLEKRMQADMYDLSQEERLEIIGYCYNKNIRSIIMAVPNPEES